MKHCITYGDTWLCAAGALGCKKIENWIERGLNTKGVYYFSTLNRRAEAKLQAERWTSEVGHQKPRSVLPQCSPQSVTHDSPVVLR